MQLRPALSTSGPFPKIQIQNPAPIRLAEQRPIRASKENPLTIRTLWRNVVRNPGCDNPRVSRHQHISASKKRKFSLCDTRTCPRRKWPRFRLVEALESADRSCGNCIAAPRWRSHSRTGPRNRPCCAHPESTHRPQPGLSSAEVRTATKQRRRAVPDKSQTDRNPDRCEANRTVPRCIV
jgi:hypothetical protein